jgi:hypothetical protein
MKRIVFCGDIHAGHRVGLTPSKYWNKIPGEVFYNIQIEMWERYTKLIDSLKPIDILVHNGDAIDGTGRRSGGSELITTDQNKQIDMAEECLRYADASTYLLTYGTAYHTGDLQDQEKLLADKLGAQIRSHLFLNVNGVNFDVRHHPTSSPNLPHTRAGTTGRDYLANLDWSQDGEQPKADVLIRSHVHHHSYAGGPGWLGMTLPALQGQGSKYGARRCSGRVHWGLVHFDIEDDGRYIWKSHVVILESQKQASITL